MKAEGSSESDIPLRGSQLPSVQRNGFTAASAVLFSPSTQCATVTAVMVAPPWVSHAVHHLNSVCRRAVPQGDACSCCLPACCSAAALPAPACRGFADREPQHRGLLFPPRKASMSALRPDFLCKAVACPRFCSIVLQSPRM